MLDHQTLLARFEDKYIPEPNSGCWLWTGACNSRGRGAIGVPKIRKTMSAHRFAYLLFKGHVPDGLEIRHTCDVIFCVNPDHLLVGTRQQNADDCKDRNRQAKGWKNSRTKLSLEQIAAIIADTRSYRKIATSYGIGKTYVGQLKSGERVRAC